MSSISPFCCVCGKPGIFPANVCPECAEKDETTLPLAREKEAKVFDLCKSCKRVLVKKRWVDLPFKMKGGIEKYQKVLCPDCYKEGVEHYTTVLKFQGLEGHEDAVKRAINWALDSEARRGKRTALTKVDGREHHYYFTHLSTARLIVKRLAASNPIQSRIDETLIGVIRDKGKGKYKMSVLVRFLG